MPHDPLSGTPDPFADAVNGHILTRGIIDTIREPLIILDDELRVLAASHSFYRTFGVFAEAIHGAKFYELGNGQWNIPELRTLLEKVLPERSTVEGYEVNHVFPGLLGRRTMLVNANEVKYQNGSRKILISIFDVTDQRRLESDRERLIAQKDLLMKEMRHRIANSLQIIASILILKAGMVKSEESRFHLQDAHERIMSVAMVQQQLDPPGESSEVPVAPYLEGLCSSLAKSMIGGRRPITVRVDADAGSVSSDIAISLGLITTELVINTIKHAFPDDRQGAVTVAYRSDGAAWSLSVKDDGVGRTSQDKMKSDGLGTSIVTALVEQLKATYHTESSPLGGTSVTVSFGNQS